MAWVRARPAAEASEVARTARGLTPARKATRSLKEECSEYGTQWYCGEGPARTLAQPDGSTATTGAMASHSRRDSDSDSDTATAVNPSDAAAAVLVDMAADDD